MIVGGGAAGNAAAETLRREGYSGRITMLSADGSVPCDRPNLSKVYLAGTAAAASDPLRPLEFYGKHRIDLKLGARAATIDIVARHVQLVDGTRYRWDALLLSTGAEPVRLEVPGATLPHVHYLRTLADSRAIVDKALASRRTVVIVRRHHVYVDIPCAKLAVAVVHRDLEGLRSEVEFEREMATHDERKGERR